MSKKIIVPQELQKEIIKLYTENGYGLEKIKKVLKLPWNQSVIKRVLKENNIHLRNFSEAKCGRYKQEVSFETQDKIIKLYEKGYGLDRIVDELQLPFGFEKVRNILQENNIHIRNVQESRQVQIFPELRKYSINDDYNFQSHNGAWMLGFFAADGYLPISKGARNRLTVSLARKDEDILYLMANELEYTGPIYQFMSQNIYPTSSLAFTSKKIRQEFEKYGLCNNKTFKLHSLPKNLPDEFILDYIRGYFDGDGSVCRPKGKHLVMSLVSVNKDFLEDIDDYLHNRLGVTKVNITSQERKSTIYQMTYHTEDSLIIGDAFYNNNYLSLPRKKAHFFKLKEEYINYKKNKKISPTRLNTPKE